MKKVRIVIPMTLLAIMLGGAAFAQETDNTYESPSRDYGSEDAVLDYRPVIVVERNFFDRLRLHRLFNKRTVFEQFFWEKEKAYRKNKRRVIRKYRRIGRLMKRPQYSDPMYFGHRDKPKKRSPEKRRFCKTCGLTH